MASVYKEIPGLAGVPAYMMARLILESRLSPRDVQIAASRLIWGMDYADIGAAVGMDRSSVSDRLRSSIVPRMLDIWPWISGGDILHGQNAP